MAQVVPSEADGYEAVAHKALAARAGIGAAKTVDVTEGTDQDISTDGMYRVFIHPSSVNFSNTSFGASNFILYGETSLATNLGQISSKSYVRDVTEVSVFPLLFFGGKLEAQYLHGTLTVDGWMRFSASGKLVALLQV